MAASLMTLPSGPYDGLAALGGYVYALDSSAKVLWQINPATWRRCRDSHDYVPGVGSFSLSGGLGEIGNPDSLLVPLSYAGEQSSRPAQPCHGADHRHDQHRRLDHRCWR